MRYNTNGALDATFASFGRVTTAFGSGNAAIGFATAIQPDGRIIVAGLAEIPAVEGGSWYFALARYLTNGALDTNFGSGGEVVTQVEFDMAGAAALTLQPDGRILAAGQTQVGVNDSFAVVRYNQDGTLDNSYGSGGIVVFNFNDGGSDDGSAVALDSSGRAVVAGDANGLFGVARLAGNPYLSISLSGPTTASVFWPASYTGWTVQQNSNLLSGSWTTSSFTVTNNGGTNSFTAPASGTDLYFRLVNP